MMNNKMKKSLLAMALGAALVSTTSSALAAKSEGTRQIHLDFHTSELIEGIGTQFSKEQFQQALKAGNVNSINVFAKGHHGWSYYNTEVGDRHPHLDFDLLKAQIEAAKEIGVRVQAYYTIGWSAKDTKDYPDAVIKDRDGNSIWFGDGVTEQVKKEEVMLPFYSWETISPEGGYADEILTQVAELVANYDLDGYFFDILPIQYPNFNEKSVEEMKAAGVDIADDMAVERHHIAKMEKFMSALNNTILSKKPDSSIFYNWTTHFSIEQSLDYGLEKYNTKLDLEDLPTTWDGYDLFPLRAKYYAPLGKEYVAMSGKFHTAWGEFGGFKHRDAIKYEAATMVAFGANVNFGDQLHPLGEMDMATYENIGHAFDYVEKIEDYGVGADHVATTALWFANSKEHDEGVVKMLLENQINFVVANTIENWSQLEVLIIPDAAELSVADAKRIQTFKDQGGKLLVLGNGAINQDKTAFMLDLGVEYLGQANFDADYTVVGDEIAGDLVRSPFLNYEPSIRVKAKKGTQVLANLREPFFNRRYSAYSSHQNTPYKLENADHPAVTRNGNVVFIASALGKSYFDMGARVHRDLFINSLNLLRTKQIVDVELPSAGRINLLHQPESERYVLHLLYASPMQRGFANVIEDIVPIHDTPVSVDVGKKIKKAYLIPGNKRVKLKRDKAKGKTAYKLNIDKFTTHTAVVFEY